MIFNLSCPLLNYCLEDHKEQHIRVEPDVDLKDFLRFPILQRSYKRNFLYLDRRDGVLVRASASQSVDVGFIPLVESYQKTLKNGIYGFPAWRSAFMGGYGE